ncbi:NUDIX hydrolase [Zooshikella marina]|uniref:NUDIX hydrolase n=1 Tax=Zooshikella ganghwensis TaxID=202772 RepID=UPI001BB079CE|nr:NUDIX hydrolase [Zooshikella ganghwensis]MBU2705692.1 NUDIX hydrolase [Zooshikella ganghwensis]
MNYCSHCGGEITTVIPEGDNRLRYVCTQCSTIHYQNPKIVAGCLPVYQNQILLCQRAIHPRAGYWTLPAGFMELNETTQQAAARETWEEACATVEIDKLYTLFNLPHINQIYLIFLAQLPQPIFSPGEESLSAELFTEETIPWDNLAFPTITKTLQYYFSDLKQQQFTFRTIDIAPHASYQQVK